MVVFVLFYASSSIALTFTDKLIYNRFEKMSPLSLLMIQCQVNVAISTVMMLYKECNPNAFHFLVKYGVIIPPITDLQEK